MRRVFRTPLAAAALVFLPLPLLAQGRFPPDSLVNVKVFPKTMPVREVINTMRGFTGALGVRCDFCHVDTHQGEGLAAFNFPSDSLRTKRTARLMMLMVQRINDSTLANIPERPTPNVAVTCMTCHRGVSRPMPLDQLIGQDLAAGGVDSATAAYRALRQQYYGRASYDFGEMTLVGVAFPLIEQHKGDDALAMLRLNLEFFPNSAPTLAVMGDAYLSKADTSDAIQMYRQALAKDPEAREAQMRLRQLGQH